MLEIAFWLFVTLVLPVVVNKSTDAERFDWIRPYLREIWTGIFAIISLYLLFKPAATEAAMSLHKNLAPVTGYVIVAAMGAALLCSYWWLAGKMFGETSSTEKVITPQMAATTPINDKSTSDDSSAGPPKTQTLRQRYEAHGTPLTLVMEVSEDITWTSPDSKQTVTTSIAETVYYDLDARAKSVGVFIPAKAAGVTAQFCLFVLNRVDATLKYADDHLNVKYRQIGEREVDAHNLQFTRAVFIYHESLMDDAVTHAVAEQYRKEKNLNVYFRGPEYETAQNFYEYSDWEKKRAKP